MVMVNNNENVNNNDVGYINDGERGATGNVRIPGPLKPVDDSKITTFTGDVYDDNFQKNQREINKQFGNAIQQLGNVEDSATDVPYYRDGNYASDINYPSSYKRAVNTIIIPTTDFNKYYNNTTNNYLPLNNGTLAIPDSVVDDGITLKVREGDIISFKLFNAIDIQYNVIFDYFDVQNNMTLSCSDLVDPRDEEDSAGLDLQHGRSSIPLFSIVPQGAKYLKIHFTLLDLPTEDIIVQVGGCGISRLITAIAKDRYTSGDSLFDIFNFTRVDGAGRTWQVGNEPETVTKTVSSSSTEVTVRYRADLFKKNRIYHVEVKNGSGEKAKVVDINHVSVSVLKQTGENTYGTIATIDNIDNTAFFIYDDNKREIETTYNNTELTYQGRTTDTYFNITFSINNSSYVNEDIITLSICEASVEDKFIHLFKQIAYINSRIDNINSGSSLDIQLYNENIGQNTINTSELFSSSMPVVTADVNPSDNCNYKILVNNESNYIPIIQIRVYDDSDNLIGTLNPTYPGYKLSNSDITYFSLQDYSSAASIEVYCQVGTPTGVDSDYLKHGALTIDVLKAGVLDGLMEVYKNSMDDESFYVSGSKTITADTRNGVITWDTAVKNVSVNDIIKITLADESTEGDNSGVGNISFTFSLYGGTRSFGVGSAQDIIKTYAGTNEGLFISGIEASSGLKGRISFQVENEFTGTANIVAYVRVLSTHAAVAALLTKASNNNNNAASSTTNIFEGVPKDDIIIYYTTINADHTLNQSFYVDGGQEKILDKKELYKLILIPSTYQDIYFDVSLKNKTTSEETIIFNGLKNKSTIDEILIYDNLKEKDIKIHFNGSDVHGFSNLNVYLYKVGVAGIIGKYYSQIMNNIVENYDVTFNNSTVAIKTVSTSVLDNTRQGYANIFYNYIRRKGDLIKVTILKYDSSTNTYLETYEDNYNCNIKYYKTQNGRYLIDEHTITNSGYFYSNCQYKTEELVFTITKPQESNDIISIKYEIISVHNQLKYLYDAIRSINVGAGGEQTLALSSGNLVVLNDEESLQNQITSQNTTYEIRHNFSLSGELSIPNNVSLFFNGGSISGGTINFNNTYVYGKPKFINNNFTGELSNTEVYFGWFSPSTSLTYDNSGLLAKAISVSKETLLIETMYPLANTVTITKRITLKGVSSKAILYANRTANAKQGFRMTACKSAFSTGTGASLSMFGLSIVGIKDLYTGGNMRVTSGSQGTFTDTDQFGNSYSINVVASEGGVSIAGIEMPLTGYINTIQDCAICGFTYGIKTMGGGIDKMTDNYFSACRWGVHFSGYTSDMMITNNKFNTCGNDVNYKSISLSGTATDISNNPEYLKEVAGGLYLRGTGMVQLDHNRFEFNFIQIVLDEANIACQIQDNMFDKATCTHILVYNGNDTAFLSQNPDHRERFQPAFSGILIDGNSFLRGANIQSNAGSASFASVAGESIFYIKNSTESQSSGFTEAAGYSENRGCILTINNNVVTDFIEVDTSINRTNINYPSCVFKIASGGDGGLIINSTGNDFTNSTATNIVNFVYGSSGKVYFNDNGSNFGNLSHAMWNDILVLNKFEIDGSKLIIYNSQSDGETISQDYVIDLSDYTLTPGSGGGSSSTPTNVYTKTEVDTLLNQLSVNSGANPFATGNVIVVSGTESNLTSLLSTQNKTFFIKGNIDLDNTDFTFAANSKYIFLNSAINNALEVYLGNNTVVQGAKFNGFKSIVLGVNSVLRDCDCDGQNASMGIYFNGNGGKVIYNKIHGIRNTFGDYTAAVRSHRTGRGSFNYLENLECSHNMFYDVTPKASGTTKLCVIYVNEVTINIDNNLIIGIHDADGTVGGQHDLDLIHIGTDMQYNDNSNDTYALPYGWQTTPNGALTTGVDSGFCSVMSTICNNTFRGIGYIKSVVKLQARDVLVSGNSITFDDVNGEWYSVFRLLRADHTLVSNNSVYYNCNKTNCRMIECSQSSDVTITGNSFMYARVGLDDIRDNTNYSQPSWRSYDIVLQTCTNLVFSNNHIYTNNRNSLPSWQCCHGLLFKDNYFHFTDPYCEASYTVVGTYLSTGVITHNPATVNSDVTFDGNVFYIEAFKRSYTSANIAVFSFATDKYLTFVNNHIKAPCSVQFNVFRVTGAEYTFKNNVIDGDKTIFNTHSTYGNFAASTTNETSAALNIEGMKVDTINVKQITSINLKNCKLVNSSTPITISSVTNFNSIDTDFTKVTASYFMKLEGGSVTGVVNGLGDVTAVQNTGNGTLGVVFKNARTNGTTTQRPANVNVGYIYFDSTVGYHVYWSGSEWLPLTTTSSGGGSSSGTGGDTPSGGGGEGGSSEGGGSSSEGGSSSSGTQTVEGQDRLVIAESSTPAWAAPDATVETDAILDEGCYVIDEANGKMAKLKSDDHTKFADGTSWDGTYGNAFRHIPAFYYKVDNGNLIISRTAITGGKSIPEMWIGCYQGYIDSSDALRSIPGVTTTGNKTCAEFYTAAQENGSDYGVMSYQAQQAIVFLYLMKYHNTNSTNTFVGDNDIHRFTGYQTFTTGSTASLGDGTGNVSYDSSRTISALFGIEALVSSRLEFRQNIYLDQTNNVAIIWDGNIAVPDQNTTTRSVSNPLANGDYIQELTWGEYGDIIPKTAQTGASASTYKNQYYCDAGYPKDGDVVVQGGLPAVTDAGGLFFFGSDPSTTKAANYGARLCMYGASSATLVTGAELASENA